MPAVLSAQGKRPLSFVSTCKLPLLLEAFPLPETAGDRALVPTSLHYCMYHVEGKSTSETSGAEKDLWKIHELRHPQSTKDHIPFWGHQGKFPRGGGCWGQSFKITQESGPEIKWEGNARWRSKNPVGGMSGDGVVDIGSGQCVCVKMVMAGDREYLCLYHLVVSGVTERHKGVTRMSLFLL